MADRYWVTGGTGSWSSTTNWSTTPGGASGASVPTSADNAIFDRSATYSVTTVAGMNCLDLSVTAGTVTFLGGGTLTCYGSFTLRTGGTWGQIHTTFAATATGKTITTNGVSMSTSNITFNGVGGGWTLGSAWVFGSIVWTNGTFSTANFNLTVSNTNGLSTAAGTKTLNWGSSVISSTASGAPSATYVNFGTTDAGLTLNAGTSTLTGPSGVASFAGGGKTFYNVTIAATSAFSDTGDYIQGANTFNNLTIQGSATSAGSYLTLYADQVVNGTFTTGSALSAASNGASLLIKSNPRGTQRTITAASKSLLCTTFQDIVAAGAAAPFTGTNIGNGGGCSNITFTAAKTVYWSLAAGGIWRVGTGAAVAWATTSGGAPSLANFPLPQDTAIIDNTGLTTGNTIQVNAATWACNITCTRTNGWIFSGESISTVINVFGNVTLLNVTSSNLTQILYNHSLGFKTAALNGNLPAVTLAVSTAPTSGFQFSAAMSNLFTLSSGTIDLNGFAWSPASVSLSPTSVGGTFTSSGLSVTVTGNNGTTLTVGSNLTFTTATTFNCTYSGSVGTRSLQGPTVASTTCSGRLNVNVTAGTDIVRWQPSSGASCFGALNFTGFSGTLNQAGTGSVLFSSLTLSSGMTLSAGSSFGTFTYNTGTVTTNGKTYPHGLSIGSAGTAIAANTTLGDAFTSTVGITLVRGTLTTSNFSVATTSLTDSGTELRTLNLGSSTVTLTASGSAFSVVSAYTTVNAGTSTIRMTSASIKSFVGGSLTYRTLEQAGAGSLRIYGSNTFYDITNTAGVACAIGFGPGETTTLANFSANGTAGNQLTFGPHTTAAAYYLAYTGTGTVNKSYCSFAYAQATPNTKWFAYTSNGNIDNNYNTGILFNPPSGFFMLM